MSDEKTDAIEAEEAAAVGRSATAMAVASKAEGAAGQRQGQSDDLSRERCRGDAFGRQQQLEKEDVQSESR